MTSTELSDPTATFIVAATVPRDSGHASGTIDRAEVIRAAHPEVADAGVHTAAILGDDATVRRFVALDAGASASGVGWPSGHVAIDALLTHRHA